METKECTKCKAILPINCFYKEAKRKDGYYPHCRDCHNARLKKYKQANAEKISKKSKEYRERTGYDKQYYQANLEKKIAYSNANGFRKRKAVKEVAVEYLGGKCSICGYDKCIAALDFHHVDPTQKDFNISQYYKKDFTDELKAELDKCILICANCHRELHYLDAA